MLRIRLPFPDRRLSPNARRVWQASLKPKREAREVGHCGALAAWYKTMRKPFNRNKPLRLRIAIHPPDNRRRDYINVLSAIKNYEDGIFDYIGWDDRHIKHVDIRWRRSCPEGKVRYILYQKQRDANIIAGVKQNWTNKVRQYS